MTRKIDTQHLAPIVGSGYPPPFDLPSRERVRKRLGDAAALTQFGINLLTLPPGACPASGTGTPPRTSSSMSCQERSCSRPMAVKKCYGPATARVSRPA